MSMWKKILRVLHAPSMWEDFVNHLELRQFVKEDQKRKGGTPEQRKAALIAAIRNYWGDDLRKATRDDRRRFARELADMIANNITAKGD